MSSQRTRDVVYGRRGGRWSDSPVSRVPAKRCEVCGLPMLVGQKDRHGVCSPPLDCCGAPVDLVGDVVAHRRMHLET